MGSYAKEAYFIPKKRDLLESGNTEKNGREIIVGTTMKIAVVRRASITHLDGVNRFVAYLAEGLRQLGLDVAIVAWSYRGVGREKLAEWFRRVHGLDSAIEVYTLRSPEERDKWVTMLYEWWRRGGGKQPLNWISSSRMFCHRRRELHGSRLTCGPVPDDWNVKTFYWWGSGKRCAS